MKNNPEPDDDPLLDAALADEQWQEFNASLRGQAIASFQTATRQRRWRRRAAQCAIVLGLVTGALAWWPRPVAPVQVAGVTRPVAPVATSGTGRAFSEQELLSMFPTGSCLVAEIDGRAQLILLEPERAAAGFKFPGGTR